MKEYIVHIDEQDYLGAANKFSANRIHPNDEMRIQIPRSKAKLLKCSASRVL